MMIRHTAASVAVPGKRPNLLILCSVVLVLCIETIAAAATLEVGPGKPFDRVEKAVAAAKPGDTIEVYPLLGGQPYERVGVSVNTSRLTIRAAGTEAGRRVTLSGRGFEHSGRGGTPRAIFQFNRGADYCVLEGFELTGASNNSDNGAGVRINQANHVTIRDCEIHHNDMGIMSNGDAVARTAINQLIEHCEIHCSGDDRLPGFNHYLYLGGTSATLRFSEVHHATTGHNVKSTAHFIRIEYSYVHHSSNREFDLVGASDTAPAGAHAVLLGNIIAKDPRTQGNRSVINFGQQGGRGTGQGGTLSLIHNTIVTPFTSPVIDLSAAKAKAVLLGNIFDDGGRTRNNQTLGRGQRGGASANNISGIGNWLAPGFANRLEKTEFGATSNTVARQSRNLYINPQQHDYGLREEWTDIVGAGRPVNALNLPPTPGAEKEDSPLHWQYDHPLGKQSRTASDRPDLGATEFVRP